MTARSTDLPPALAAANEQIRATAKSYGLDFFETIFEMLDYDQINQIASFGGFPVRYPHWRFGMEYERMSKHHNYGLGRIYEMVINNDPCYAYLQRSNSITDQKLVMAHVYAHCDFFKNNLWFSRSNRKMMDGMANHATHIRKHIERFGLERVEKFIDICLSIETLIDPHSLFLKRGGTAADETRTDSGSFGDELAATRFHTKNYMDRFINPRKLMEEERLRLKAEQEKKRNVIPSEPVRDVLLFLLERAPLEPWQQEILAIIRDEAYYFAPQAMTKIMNEGWATFWHSTIMTRHYLSAAEIIDYADHHSGTVHMPPGGGGVNPYKIGVEIFRDIEDRWNKGKFGKEYDELTALGDRDRWEKPLNKGREKIFEVRRIYNDVNFIEEFLTEELVDRLKLYQYRHDPHSNQLRIVSRDYKRIKEAMLYRLTNMGQPYIYVIDANYKNTGELYLAHKHNGFDIDVQYAIETLKGIQTLWSRPVHLQAKIDDDMKLLSFDGKQSQQQKTHGPHPG
ncbi:MAG: SpoVR family protein [Phycisphaerales bacterium]|nr:SpoVR family protein [Phycisphaerales bacterium]